MDALDGWADAPAFLLSAPGSLGDIGPYTGSVVPIAQHQPFQCLFGASAQLMAYALATRAEAGRTFLCRAPELFDGAASRAFLAETIGRPAPGLRRVVHLRFGPARRGRVLKGARNAHVLAEDHQLHAGEGNAHPLASGLCLPASVGRVLYYEPDQAAPRTLLGAELHGALLPPETVTADLALALRASGPAPGAPGLWQVPFETFDAEAWRSPAPKAGTAPTARRVLLPWNLAHPGSLVPTLLARLTEVAEALPDGFGVTLFPFNGAGQGAAAIARLVAEVAAASPALSGLLAVGRLGAIAALPLLLRGFGLAWVDGNDPEHRWTLRRLVALGMRCLLIDANPAAALPDGCGKLTRRIAADAPVRVVGETELGPVATHALAPSWRGLGTLLRQTDQGLRQMPRAAAEAEAALVVRPPRAGVGKRGRTAG